MTDPHDPERLRALEKRIEQVKGAQIPRTSRSEEGFSQANMAWRMVIELVAGLMIGFGMGFGLDKLFGTTPLFLVLFIGFGLAAGVKTMMGTAREMQEGQSASAKEGTEDDNAGAPAPDERD